MVVLVLVLGHGCGGPLSTGVSVPTSKAFHEISYRHRPFDNRIFGSRSATASMSIDKAWLPLHPSEGSAVGENQVCRDDLGVPYAHNQGCISEHARVDSEGPAK